MNQKNSETKQKAGDSRWFGKRDLAEWGVILLVGAVLYATGLHTEVLGRLQQAVLWTGLIQPETEVPVSEREAASYDMQLISFEGEPVSLAEFRGKVIFLNYWATWCPPCIAEMPNIQALYEQYRDNEQVKFVMVSMDEEKSKADDFLERKDFTLPVYQLAGPRPKSLQSTILPTTFVIGKEGRILVKKRGMANYNTAEFRAFLDTQISN
ncbi:TlpA family protein disulfide reductase [Halalkalibaculum sp. DA3122]|uniref:TlpA family protein disulfide reductase n=1 Tax=unclassified Halalkalibaculum TaxID=2964617 RepID=UPI0037552FED